MYFPGCCLTTPTGACGDVGLVSSPSYLTDCLGTPVLQLSIVQPPNPSHDRCSSPVAFICTSSTSRCIEFTIFSSCGLIQCPIVERLCCALMRKGRNSGKKLMAARIVKHTLEIIHLLTDQNPVQVRFVNGIWRASRTCTFFSCLCEISCAAEVAHMAFSDCPTCVLQRSRRPLGSSPPFDVYMHDFFF